MINQNIINTQPTERTAFYHLPKFLSQIEHITTVDTGGLEFVICCDKMKLFIFPLIPGSNKPLGTIHQSLPIPNIKSLKTIAKNYLMIETQNKYIGIFEIIKSTSKQVPTQKPINTLQVNAVKVEFSEVLKWRIFSCYFVRQVMENLFEVQVFFTDLQFEIFQFTNKNKRGSMSFSIFPNGKIQKSNKRQLYGSKCFFNIGRKLMYWLKNFSDKQFILQEIVQQQPVGGNKLLSEPFGYFGIQRAQQYKCIYGNLVVRDCINPAKRHPLRLQKQSFLNDLKVEVASLSPAKKKSTAQQNPFNELVQQSTSMQNISKLLQSYKITNFTDFMMVQNKCKKQMQVYQIKADGSQLIGKQDSHVLPLNQSKWNKIPTQNTDNSLSELRKWQWYFGNSKKLIAIDRLGFRLKYIQQISPDNRNQNKIQAEVTNLSQKMDEIQQEPLKQDQKSVQNQTQESSQNLTKQINQNAQEIIQQKRKFSKDQLQKFCQEFKDQDADKYVNKQLIKKVDEVNHWVKKEVSAIQKVSHSIKSLRPTLQTMPKQQKKQEKIIQKQNKVVKQTQKNESQQSNINETKIQNTSSKTNAPQITEQPQGVINLKQKPPMKIIQRNKISVAKTFNSQNGNQTKTNQQQNKQQVKKQTIQTKQQKQTQKNTIQPVKKTQTSSPTTFVKYRLKQEPLTQSNNNEKQKKRFMKNYLNPDKKQQNIQKTIKKQEQQKATKKIQEMQQKHIENKKIQVPQKIQTQQKQEKIKFNVITRASLMKKKQEDSVKQTKPQVKKKQKDEKIQQTNKSQIVEKCSLLNLQKEQKLNQLKSNQSRKASQQQNNLIEQKSPKSQGQVQPKTKFVPSIDINKASTNQLNECQFLSQDSISEEDKTQNVDKAGQFDSSQNEQQIQQQIQVDQNIGSSDQQPDLEHLIDDDIIVEKKEQKNDIKSQTSQVVNNEAIELQKEKVISKKQQPKQIDQQEEIQKFCNTLLEQQPITKNNKKESISSGTKQKGANPTQKIQIINFNNLSSVKSQIPSKLIQHKSQCINPQQKSEQDNQMNQFNSLLFKTSIKRTNIFSSQISQNQDKTKQFSTITQNKIILTKQVQTQIKDENIDQIKKQKQEQIKKIQTQIPLQNQSQINKFSQQKIQQTKKLNDWYQSSSEQNVDGQQKQNQPFQQKDIKIQNQINQTSQNNKILSDQKTENISQIEKQQIQQQNKQVQQTQQKLTQQRQVKDFLIEQLQTQQKNKQSQKEDNDSQITNKVSSNSSLTNSTTVNANTSTLFLNNPVSSAHWLTNRPPANITTKKDANPFINFKKSNHDHQQISQQNIFNIPPNSLPSVPNSNLFKKFLNQRQTKNISTIKSQQSGLPIPTEKFETKILIKKQQMKNIISGKQQKKYQQIKSEKLMIPTSALPQIQQLISRYEQTTLEHLEKQQKNIVKSLQQIPQTHNPYNKNNSLILPQEIKQQIIKQSKNSLKKWLSTKMLDKIQVSFRQIMQQHKAIYEQALKYYENEARRKITTMQLQYEQQSSILTDIENVSSNMCAALQSTILQGEQLHTYQLKQWKREIQQKQANIIDPLTSKIQDTKSFYDSRNKNLQVMTNELKQIKDILKQKLKKKQQLKQIKQKRKIQKQQKMKQKVQQELNKKIKIKQQSKKQSKTRRNVEQPQQDRVQFYNQPSQRQHQSPYYGNQPYPYY